VWKSHLSRFGLAVAVVVACSACGGNPGTVGDGGPDGTLSDAPHDGHGGKDGTGGKDGSGKDGSGGKDTGGSDSGSTDSATTDAPGCLKLGGACSTSIDCCGGVCLVGVCSPPPCVSDTMACTTGAECCSGACGTAGTCTPLATGCGGILGDICKVATDCCSGRCAGGLCEPSGFCEQNGDVCTTGADCCGGVCNIASGATKGICAQPPGGPANCTAVDGTLCGGIAGDGGTILDEAGLPSCGGACCSRLCAPYEPTGVLICQPASGCHVVGDLCTKDTDCCGSVGMPGEPTKPVTCSITPPNKVGVCRNPIGCKPNGDVCKLATASCNASCDCCAGNCETMDTCKQDSLGVPRCANVACGDAGASCASSADCCGGLPCVPDPSWTDGGTAPPFICGTTLCVSCGACTVSADCCPGQTCSLPIGSTDGVCGPCPAPDGGVPEGGTKEGGIKDGGAKDSGPPPCSLYGQECTTSSNCCNGVPCSLGTLPCAAGDTGCTCHYLAVP
jgi:hypothetical protein